MFDVLCRKMKLVEMEEFRCREYGELPSGFVDVFLAWPKLRELEANFGQPLRADDVENLLLRCPLLRVCRLQAFYSNAVKRREPRAAAPAIIHELKHLEYLHLSGCTVDDAFFSSFNFPRLETLTLAEAAVHVLRFEEALARMPACKHIVIGFNAEVQLTRAAAPPLALQNLHVYSSACHSRDWWFLLRSASRLIELEICARAFVTRAQLSMIPAHGLRNLSRAELQPESNAAVTADAITAFIELCPALRELMFTEPAITGAIVDELVKRYKGRKRAVAFELRDSNCQRAIGLPPLLIFDENGVRKPPPQDEA